MKYPWFPAPREVFRAESRPWKTDLSAGTLLGAILLGLAAGMLSPLLALIGLVLFLQMAPPAGGLRDKLAENWEFSRRFALDAFWVALGCTVITLAVTACWKKVLWGFGFDGEPMQKIAVLFLESPPWKQCLLACTITIAAPLAEELFFRRLLYDFCSRFLPCFPAAVMTAFLFAAAHWHELSLPGLWIFGLILQWVYWKTRNLLIPIAIHAYFNGIALAGLLFFS